MSEHSLSRREFLSKSGLLIGCGYLALSSPIIVEDLLRLLSGGPRCAWGQSPDAASHAARYWIAANSPGVDCLSCHSMSQLEGKKQYDHEEKFVKCLLCAQGCVMKENERGKCRARININGNLRSLVYGKPIAIHIDPIEKKPFFHFLPGSQAYSFATAGCPLSCQFCQNWEISQSKPEDFSVRFIPPAEIADDSESQKAPIIAFTYNEPTVFIEYLTDVAREARKKKIRSVMVSCGFMNEEPLREMCEVLDAIKIDLKGFSEDFYHRVCSAELKPVLRSIKQVSKTDAHLEIVNLVVPTLNDSDGMLNELSNWIMGETGPDVPVHFTKFHPDYKLLNLPPTPISTLERAREIAMSKGIHYAFVGNVPGHPGSSTYCPNCGKVVINRTGFFVTENHIKNRRCKYCGHIIAGVWS
ncbi:MAG: AmmeMemoRadiSam system radical SAM enzyme [Bacteroidetes bacterium]|nr:AmmeMemoRadiSam system radical SAM enzyme [Bacteroidota bacterium]